MFLNSVFAQDINNIKNASDVIEKAIEALGGKEYLLSINTLYTKMEYIVGDQQYCMITKEQLPYKTSTVIYENDSAIIKTVFDGKNGYHIINGERENFSNKSLKNNLFSELDYLDKSLWKIELQNEDIIDGEEVFKISAKQITGLIRILYYSKSNFHLLKRVEFKNKDDENYEMIDYFGYKKYGMLTYYSTWKLHNGPLVQELKIVELLTNEKIISFDFE